MSISASYPNLRPTLLLDFANSGRLDPRVTFTRASTATFFDATGTLQSAAIDVPRFDYNPATLAAQGLLIEEARTNSIRNNTMQGAVAGTPGTLPTNWLLGGSGPGTLTSTVVGIGASNGITYVDIKLSGTTSTTDVNVAFEPGTQIAALTGQTWTESVWVAIVGGSSTNITNLRFQIAGRNSGGTTVETFLSSGLLGSLTGTLQRFTLTSALANATTAFIQPNLRFDFSSGVAIDITLRIGLPQLEQGAFATSVIPTTTTALTRSADVASVNTLSPWFNSTEYTLYHEGMVLTNDNGIVYSGVGDTFDNTAYFTRVAPNQSGAVLSSAAPVAQMNVNTTPSSGVPFKMAMKVKANDFAFCVNGGSVTTDTSGAVPASTVRLGIGSSPWTALGGNSRQQWVRRITFYSRGFSSAELQALTA